MKIQLTNNLQKLSNNSIVGKYHNYTMDSAKITHANILTENINACVAGVISAGKANMMFHLAPEQQNLKKLEDTFYRKMNELFDTAKTDEFDAILTGSWGCSAPDIDTAYKGIKIYNKVAEMIEDLKGRLSIFCGKEQDDIDNLQFNKNGCVNLASQNWAKYGVNIDNVKNAPREEVVKMLENKYETVEVHPTHVFIG